MAITVFENHKRLVPGHVLQLRVKREFFDMIRKGLKPFEYRELKHYWATRLMHGGVWLDPEPGKLPIWVQDPIFKQFDAVHIINGYGATSPDIITEFAGITVDFPEPKYTGSMAGTFDATRACFAIGIGAITFDSLNGK